MSPLTHLAVLGLLVLDLLVGGWAAGKLAGHYATLGFEFLMILGYILLVLQFGVPWGNHERDDSQQ